MAGARRVIAGALALAGPALACGHAYVVRPARVFEGRAVNAAVDRVQLSAFGQAEVDLRVAGRPGTAFRAAALNGPATRPCAAGNEFAAVELNGTRELQGPLDVSGSHRLSLSFVAPREPRPTPAFLDLSFEAEGARECLRIPLHRRGLTAAREAATARRSAT